MKKIITLFISILITAFAFTGCSGSSSDREEGGQTSAVSTAKEEYVMTINGEEISAGEFSIYLFEQKTTFEETGGSDIWDTDFNGVPASEVAKENAYNSVLYVKTACENAEEVSVSLTEEDKAEAAALAEETFGEMNPEYCKKVGLDLEKTTEVMEEIVLHQKVRESVTKAFQLSEADYSAYVDSYMEQHPENNSPRATLESTLREDYIRSKKDEIYKDQINKWAENIKAEKNTAVWDSIEITEL
ncbi:MAG: SurA N-terminal domain-containing protein [Clostridiales bacterium]|nr:SurA N-terminal domain-containing protein [Clostridiales bacterium]